MRAHREFATGAACSTAPSSSSRCSRSAGVGSWSTRATIAAATAAKIDGACARDCALDAEVEQLTVVPSRATATTTAHRAWWSTRWTSVAAIDAALTIEVCTRAATSAAEPGSTGPSSGRSCGRADLASVWAPVIIPTARAAPAIAGGLRTPAC